MSKVNKSKLGTVVLDSIKYGGEDIGSELEFIVTVEAKNNDATKTRKLSGATMKPGQTKEFKDETWSVVRYGDKPALIVLKMEVFERDRFQHDHGTGKDAKHVDLSSSDSMIFPIVVSVAEGGTIAEFEASFRLVEPTFFFRLWNNYPLQNDVLPRETFKNQCVVKATSAVQAVAPDLMKQYEGATSVSEYNNWDDLPAYGMRTNDFESWLDKLAPSDTRIKEKRIVSSSYEIDKQQGFIYYDKIPGYLSGQGGHVDLWYRDVGAKAAGHEYWNAETIYFWEVVS